LILNDAENPDSIRLVKILNDDENSKSIGLVKILNDAKNLILLDWFTYLIVLKI